MKNENVIEVTVKIEGAEWQEALDKAFEKANKKVTIDGFRPGKAPKDMFIKKYGVESLFMDAGDLVLESAYRKVLEDNKDLELVAQPDISLKSVDEKHIEFNFTLTKKPTVKLGKYKALKVAKDAVEVTKKEIDETIDSMRQRYAENVEKESGIVENGDITVIDFEGFKDGVAFDGGKGENYNLTIGSNTFILGFEEQLIGMKKGESKDINVTFPEDYHSEDLKGAPVVFKVKVNEIKSVVIPEINDDFFADLGMDEIKTEEDLRKQVEENIKVRKEADSDNKYIDDLLKEAAKTTEVDIPDNMIHEEAHRMVHQYEEQLKMQGITLEQFYQFTNSNEEALIDQMHDEAKNRVLYRLMLEEIAKVEKIEITDEQADSEATKLAEKYQMKKEEFLNAFGSLDMIKYDLTMKGAIDIIKGE
ncbi:MAG TPA: trigger factor [Bacilli bacterium]|nr:trigger factor [Bacilli bacterium]